MPDPRGGGFKRGKGKWHRPVRYTKSITPEDCGWQLTPTLEQPGYVMVFTQQDYTLRRSLIARAGTYQVTDPNGQVTTYANKPILQLTLDLFGENHLMAPPENSGADWHGVAPR